MTMIGTMVLSFGQGGAGAGGIRAEWEELKNAKGKVKTAYGGGDAASLLVHAIDPAITIIGARISSGTITAAGEVVVARTDQLGFAAAGEEQQLSYLPAGSPSFAWYGNAGAGPAVNGQKIAMTGGQFPCLGDISYPVRFTKFSVQTPEVELHGDETWPLLVSVDYIIAGGEA